MVVKPIARTLRQFADWALSSSLRKHGVYGEFTREETAAIRASRAETFYRIVEKYMPAGLLEKAKTTLEKARAGDIKRLHKTYPDISPSLP